MFIRDRFLISSIVYLVEKSLTDSKNTAIALCSMNHRMRHPERSETKSKYLIVMFAGWDISTPLRFAQYDAILRWLCPAPPLFIFKNNKRPYLATQDLSAMSRWQKVLPILLSSFKKRIYDYVLISFFIIN